MKYDNHMLDLVRQCPRKFFYQMVLHKVRSGSASIPLEYGLAVHKIKEDVDNKMDVEEAIQNSVDKFSTVESMSDSKRTCNSLSTLMEAYFEHYKFNKFKPIGAEMGFELPLNSEHTYMGRLDCVGEMPGVEGKYLMDTKTSSSPTNFILKPNNQFAGYVWAGKQLYGQVNGLIVDLIGVYKNKPARRKDGNGWLANSAPSDVFFRYNTSYEDWELVLWKEEVLHTIEFIDRCTEKATWPRYTNACNAYFTECPYKQLCLATVDEQATLLNSDIFEERIWNPIET